MNALVRLIIYVSVALSFYSKKQVYLYIGLACILAISFAVPLETFKSGNRPPCQRPTRNNPFANFLPTDDPRRPPACPYKDVKNEITKTFQQGLYRDVDDVFGMSYAQRQFFVNPVTQSIPNTREVAEFFYGGMNKRHKHATIL
jgi:hypothetical protein